MPSMHYKGTVISTDMVVVAMRAYSFRIPPYYTLLVRSLTVLEGIALASDQNYKVSSLMAQLSLPGNAHLAQL